ncbi:MAG: hypothetical protein JXR64_06565 [Spirochaetales bacterium]|nr:hypothetical protein [Spirochaetales bacterium]
MKKYFFILLLCVSLYGYSNSTIKSSNGKIPVLCFHIIGDGERYEISPDNFEKLLIYLNKNNFFVISDKEFINKDFSQVPNGFKPIVLGSDDASEGNFIYKTDDNDILNGRISNLDNPEIDEKSMVGILKRNLAPRDGKINFTFYVSFNGIPFRQSGGESFGSNYRNNPIVANKFNYIIDNFILGIHTVNHPVTKDTSVSDFKNELVLFYEIMETYVGEKYKMIDTLAYPYGCADLKPEMQQMIEDFNYKGQTIIGGFDFDGYFSKSPLTNNINKYDISRLGVDNYNIDKVYGFLENVKLFVVERVENGSDS